MGILGGKTAIITGGSSGIGEAIAHRFAEEGASVALIARDAGKLSRVADAIKKMGAKVIALSADVRDEKAISSAFREVNSEFGRIDVLVNSAGVGAYSPVVDMSLDDWRKVIDINLTGTFICCKIGMRYMMDQGGGRIINISSVAGKLGFATGSAYCASKWGQIGFSRSLAAEAKSHNIRVDVICPGTVDTPFPHSPAASPVMLEAEDVVQAVMFVLSLPDRVRVEDVVLHPYS